MLIKAITFEIHDFKANIHDDYVIELTPENLELVNTHRHTRNIAFASFQDFDFARKMHTPADFIDTRILIAVINRLADKYTNA